MSAETLNATAPPSAVASGSGAPVAGSAASAASALADGGAALDAGALSDAGAGVDAGKGADGSVAAVPEDCRLVRGPARLSLKGPAALPVLAGGVQILFNRQGAPGSQVPAFPALQPSASSGPAAGLVPNRADPALPKNPLIPEGAPQEDERATWPACVVAGRYVFCMDLEGSIHRRLVTGEGDKIIAKGRPGTPIAAAAVGSDHTILAFLASMKTSEGVVTHALAVLDDGPLVQLSEEGSGATFVALAPREKDVLAMYIDARVALTPVHARTLTVEGSLRLGKDAVVHVGEGSERRSVGAIARAASGPAFLLMPLSTEGTKFGMATMKVEGDPQDDSPVVWSFYPNGLSPAPIAATQGVSPARVVRVRPATAAPDAWRVLELGHLEADGSFKALCNVIESRSFTDVNVAVDGRGSVWIVYTSADGTWVEQRGRS
jgi:hypothetical protein